MQTSSSIARIAGLADNLGGRRVPASTLDLIFLFPFDDVFKSAFGVALYQILLSPSFGSLACPKREAKLSTESALVRLPPAAMGKTSGERGSC
jgi:hypothetical protein